MAQVTDSLSKYSASHQTAPEQEVQKKETLKKETPKQEASRESASPMTTSSAATPKQSAALPSDTITVDTAHHDTSYVLVVEPPIPLAKPERHHGPDSSSGMSWVITGLLMLFVIVAIRFRNNSKYLSTLLRSAVEVRERGNVFDDTVRETSFMIVLNILWNICAGILLFTLADGSPDSPTASAAMGRCTLIAFLYTLFLTASYAVVGNVFSDRLHTRMWLRGYLAATGLTTLIIFPCALIALCYPLTAHFALNIAIIAFIIGKIIFISKGFRIFFTQIDSWLLFLYYLCSLEIVPLVFLYLAARWAVNFV